jgi:squalene-associated FAD-dependent desaturase
MNHTGAEETTKPAVVVLGGGLAGLAAATALAPRGFRVTVLESRNRLGGRASSFTDVASGQLIDTCQHVSMGCCTNLAHFCRTVGVDRWLRREAILHFMTPDGRVSAFGAGSWPAPFHLAGSFLRAHFLTPAEKLRVAWGLACLRLTSAEGDSPFGDWLRRHGQTPRMIRRFWGLVLVSALNEVPERVGLRYARKVFVDGFMRHRRGFELELPTVPLGRLYGEELSSWLLRHGVDVRLNSACTALGVVDRKVRSITLRDGSALTADWYIAALPADRLLDILSADIIKGNEYFAPMRQLQTSPIVSVHVWFDRPITALPHVVLVDSVGQWLFNRGETAPGEHYVQVIVSAARQLRDAGNDETLRLVLGELRQLFPAAAAAQVRRAKVVTEHAATFSAVPGVDRWRPIQKSPIGNLFLAGDWTQTGWPATMESAVRSGYLAAMALLERLGRKEMLLQPDLR